MIYTFVSLALFALAAICNAVMDTLQFHFGNSVFKEKNQYFWNPLVSCNYAPFFPFTKYRIDAWHLFKSGMIVLIATGSVIMMESEKLIDAWWYSPILLITYGFVWNLSFNLFFNKILIRE